jgi:hypothetical protein
LSTFNSLILVSNSGNSVVKLCFAIMCFSFDYEVNLRHMQQRFYDLSQEN